MLENLIADFEEKLGVIFSFIITIYTTLAT